MTALKNRLQTIRDSIKQAEQKAGRSTDSVKLLAVSKTWPAEKLREVAEQGQCLFGENYLQEALDKIQTLVDLNLEWHFIGPIQSNKTRDIAAFFDWAQTVDRLKIARRLNEQRPADLPALQVCIQVNIDEEQSKSGVSQDEILELAAEIQKLDRLNLRGLMIIPAKKENEQAEHDSFKRAYKLFETLKDAYPQVDTLSMGMTGDMQTAIAEGSTMVRIGTALFGQRSKKAE